MAAYILPAVFVILIIICADKRINVYDCFAGGAGDAMRLMYTIFPYILAIFVFIELFRESGMADFLTRALEKPLSFLGIPPALAELLLLRPVSGNGTLAILEKLFEEHGPDSYVSRCAAVIMGSSETIFYIAAVYFSSTKIRKLKGAVAISLAATLFGSIAACFLCRFL